MEFNLVAKKIRWLFNNINDDEILDSIGVFGPTINNIIKLLDCENIKYKISKTPNFDLDRSDDEEFINCLFRDRKYVGNVIITTHESFFNKGSFLIDYSDLREFIDVYENEYSTTFFTERDLIFIFPKANGISLWSHEGVHLPFTPARAHLQCVWVFSSTITSIIKKPIYF